ncbi:MAG: glutamate--tRNA ligase family protein [Actinomycetota bacterium]|nr:glutamate--tRNA ligase family protein [Actinomycetota bacterium]MEC7590399.1 glutamate--tRNA ligase family protein [Actinomycetota bacterium]MEC8648694.1 glutamate--tRNA ligase family protein [Actinomycetota bacterium]
MRTRLAPTPSGFVHEGNLVNFLVISHVAQTCDAAVALRLDDIDRPRIRGEYIDDIFRVLTWLEIPWTDGPRSTADMAQWTQHQRLDRYQRAREELWMTGLAYHCTCSRTQWNAFTGDSCPGECRQGNHAFQVGRTATRLHLDGIPDPIIWRRDDLPAYHLTSIVDDCDGRIDLVVRGEDLASSTDVQRRISHLLPGNTFHQAHVLHHPLVTSEGRKLSKSAGAQASPLTLSHELRATVSDVAATYSASAQADLLRSREC